MTRNRVTHNANVNISRTEAYRFISYLKTYLRETGLVNDDVITGEIRCYSCNRLIDRQWHYCPDCGADLSSTCKTCGEHLKPGWTNCPVCSTPRDGVKVSNPKTVYGFYCQAVWSDGYLNAEEMRFLRRKQRELGLDDAKALKIQKKYAPDAAMIFRGMVEASLTDGVIDNREKIFLRNEADRLGIDHKLANSIYLSCINDTISEPLFNEEDDGS
jgi:RNA polymerase subunit RPABC4/transcription elongation factor Spt4